MNKFRNIKGVSVFISVSVVLFFYILRPFQLLEPTLEQAVQTERFLPDELLASYPYGPMILELRDLSYVDINKAMQRLIEIDNQGIFKKEPIYYAYYFKILKKIAKENGEWDKVNYYTLELNLFARNNEFPWLKAELIIDSAIVLLKSGKMEEGIVETLKAIELAKAINYDYLLVKAYNTLGVSYNIQSQYAEALRFFHLGLKTGAAYPHYIYNSKIIANLGLIYTYLEEWDKALENIKKSKALYEISDKVEDESLAINAVNTSYIYFNLSDAVSARKHYERASDLVSTTDEARLIGLLKKTESDVLWIEGDYQQSLVAANECLSLQNITNFPQQVGLCYIARARVEIKLENYKMAINSLQKALNQFNMVKNKVYMVQVYSFLSESYEKSGNTELGLKYYKQYATLDKETLFDRRQGEVFHLEEEFNTREIKKNNELLNTQSKLNSLYVEKQQLRTRVVASIVLLVGFGVFFLIRRNFTIEQENEVLVEQSTTDALTGLNNRHHYNNTLKEFKANKPLYERTKFAIAVIDVDFFKKVNDNYGHEAGDEVLNQVAMRLSSVIEDSDLLVRWGGEEFVCLLPESEYYACEIKLERLRMAICQLPIMIEEHELNISISIGAIKKLTIDDVVYINKHCLQLADECLYQAKEEGRNRVVFQSKT